MAPRVVRRVTVSRSRSYTQTSLLLPSLIFSHGVQDRQRQVKHVIRIAIKRQEWLCRILVIR